MLNFRVKKFTKMSDKVATGVLSGVVKVSGYVTSTVANSRAGKKFFDMLPGEVVLASLDGFGMSYLNPLLFLYQIIYIIYFFFISFARMNGKVEVFLSSQSAV